MSSPLLRALRSHIDDLRRGGRDRVAYAPPTPQEAAAYKSWVKRVALAAKLGAPMPSGAPPGFELEALSVAPDLWLLAERDAARRGAGAVVLRRGDANNVVIEAPHTFFDQGTLPIALVAFDSQRARGLLVNTVHRFRAAMTRAHGAEGDEDEPRAAVSSDVAHAERSFFLDAHDALLETFPNATIQLTGLSRSGLRGPRSSSAQRAQSPRFPPRGCATFSATAYACIPTTSRSSAE